MSKPTKLQIAIIGGGAAGIMAALRGVLNNDEVVLFAGAPKDKKKSRAQWVTKVENIPGYAEYKKGIDNPTIETIKWIKASKFADKFQMERRSIDKIKKLDNEHFELVDDKENIYHAEYVVLATGVMDIQPMIQGSMEPVFPYANRQLIDYCIRCDGHHIKDKKSAVIGHTDVAAWVAVILQERYQTPQFSLLTNGEKHEYGEKVQELLKLYNIKIYDSAIKEIKGRPKELVMDGFELEDGTFVESEIAFVSLGMLVYNDLAKQVGAQLDERGFVLTANRSESTVKNFYAVGDVQADTKKQIYTSWDNAVDALDSINGKIRAKRREQLLELYRAENNL